MALRDLFSMNPFSAGVRWPRRVAFPIAGVLVAIGLPAGLLTIHVAFEYAMADTVPATQWALGELTARPLTYGYMLICGATLLGFLGRMLGKREDQLEALSITDPLTGMANRRRLLAALGEEMKRAVRYGTPVALLLLDVDHLKQINDGSGHGAGDRALQLVAEGIRRSCRETDVPARVGGDEMAVLAPNTTAAEALALAHRIRSILRAARPSGRGGVALTKPPTISVGVADLYRAAAPTIEALHAAADDALYRAKANGRDRVAVAPLRRPSTTGALPWPAGTAASMQVMAATPPAGADGGELAGEHDVASGGDRAPDPDNRGDAATIKAAEVETLDHAHA